MENSQIIKYRVGVAIETPLGLLLTQEGADYAIENATAEIEQKRQAALHTGKKARANRYQCGKDIVKGGRFATPGGGPNMTDFEVAQETKLVDEIGATRIVRGKDIDVFFPDLEKLPLEIRSRVVRVMQFTAIREVKEELGIEGRMENIAPLTQIMGDARRHVIYILSLDGEVQITDPKISGIGFLDEKHTLPLAKLFFQGHVRSLYTSYIKKPDRAAKSIEFRSRLTFPINLLEDWYKDELAAYHYLSGKGRQRMHMPTMPESRPDFRILDRDGRLLPLRSDSGNFTVARSAGLIPRSHTSLSAGADVMRKTIKTTFASTKDTTKKGA